MLFSEHLVSY